MAGRIASERLARLARTEDGLLEPAEAALFLAAEDRPHVVVDAYLDQLEAMAGELAESCEDAAGRAEILARVLGRSHRFRGDERDDDDIANANLMWVMDHRRGVAEALGILFLGVARRAGWAAEMLAFPGHALVRIEGLDGSRAIIDPFMAGQELLVPEMRALWKARAGLAAELQPSLFAPLSNRDMLVRLQNGIKLRLLRCGLLRQALEVVEGILAFAPCQTALWREAGLMHLRLDDLPGAVAALEQFIRRSDDPQAQGRARQMLNEIRARMH